MAPANLIVAHAEKDQIRPATAQARALRARSAVRDSVSGECIGHLGDAVLPAVEAGVGCFDYAYSIRWSETFSLKPDGIVCASIDYLEIKKLNGER